MIAVIKTGGKQYLVTPGQTITIEKISTEAGQKVAFDQVLLVENGTVKLGDPLLKGVSVDATVIAHGRADKVTTIKFHNKVRYRRKIGHRQPWTKVKIDSISA